jgi:hypothetical protein
MNLKCVVLRHRWRPAEETNEAGLRLACTRCGKVRSQQGTQPDQGTWYKGDSPNAGGL